MISTVYIYIYYIYTYICINIYICMYIYIYKFIYQHPLRVCIRLERSKATPAFSVPIVDSAVKKVSMSKNMADGHSQNVT